MRLSDFRETVIKQLGQNAFLAYDHTNPKISSVQRLTIVSCPSLELNEIVQFRKYVPSVFWDGISQDTSRFEPPGPGEFNNALAIHRRIAD